MASKLPWTTPKVQTLYTTSSVGRLIAEYLDAGGQILQMREGVLGHGDVLLYDDAGKLKTYVILWAGNEREQIKLMRMIYRRLCEAFTAPEWMSEEKINEYAEQMLVV